MGWATSVAIGLTAATALFAAGVIRDPLVVGLALTTKNPLITLLLLAAFVVAAVLAALAAVRARTPRTFGFLWSQLDTTSLLPVCLAMFLVILLVYIASQLGEARLMRIAKITDKQVLQREEAARRLHEIADELASGNDVVIERDDLPFNVTVPGEVRMKVEVEIESDEHEIEVKLPW